MQGIMIRFDDISRIYIAPNVTDLRKGIDSYAAIVQNEFKQDPFSDAMYIFCNRTHDKLKILYWDGTGFWLLYKRLESGHFKWQKAEDGKAIEITKRQLAWLLDGLKIEQKTSIRAVQYQYM